MQALRLACICMPAPRRPRPRCRLRTKAVAGGSMRRLAGWVGVPFAQDALVGNIPTEVLLSTLRGLGAATPDLEPLDGLVQRSLEIARKYGTALQ